MRSDLLSSSTVGPWLIAVSSPIILYSYAATGGSYSWVTAVRPLTYVLPARDPRQHGWPEHVVGEKNVMAWPAIVWLALGFALVHYNTYTNGGYDMLFDVKLSSPAFAFRSLIVSMYTLAVPVFLSLAVYTMIKNRSFTTWRVEEHAQHLWQAARRAQTRSQQELEADQEGMAKFISECLKHANLNKLTLIENSKQTKRARPSS